MMQVYFPIPITKGLIRIAECYQPGDPAVNMYLVRGTAKSLLFDSGFGLTGTLRHFVEQLTNQPVVCVVGHGHPDHVGGAALFDTVYMNPKDEALLPVSLSTERRMGDVFGHGCTDEDLKSYCEEHIVLPERLEYFSVQNGDILELGGIKLTAYEIPGHTQGSIALYNQAEDYALISDAVSHRTALVTLPAEKRVGLLTYRDSLANFLSAIRPSTALYWGHGNGEMEQDVLRDMHTACTEVLEGQTENDVQSVSHFAKRQAASGKDMREHRCGCVTLVYDAKTL